jgi:hypothetical protein
MELRGDLRHRMGETSIRHQDSQRRRLAQSITLKKYQGILGNIPWKYRRHHIQNHQHLEGEAIFDLLKKPQKQKDLANLRSGINPMNRRCALYHTRPTSSSFIILH